MFQREHHGIGKLMLPSNDMFAVIRHSGYVAPFLVFFAPPLRLLILLGVFLVLLLERRTKLLRQTPTFQIRQEGLAQQELLWTQRLPLWVGCLLLTEHFFRNGPPLPLRYPVRLSATREGYSLNQSFENHVGWVEYCLEGAILLLCILPVLSVFIPFTLIAIGLASGAVLAQVYLQKHAFNHYLRAEEPEMQDAMGIQKLPKVRTFRSYLPQENVPAFAWRSWRGQEIYLDARLLAPASIVQALLVHEQGHIALGHTTLLFLLQCCRYITISFGLLVISLFGATLGQASGPGALPWLLAFIGGLLAPEIVKLIRQDAWEQQADHWAAIRLGQGAVHTARLYVLSRYRGAMK